METKRPIYINITAMAVIKIILIFVLFFFLFLIREVLAILFVSLILSSALNPWVDCMQKKKIPRAIGMLFIYFILFSVVGSIIYLIIPPIIEQVVELSGKFPQILERVVSGFAFLKDFTTRHGILDSVKENMGSFSSNLQGAVGEIFSRVSGVLGGIITFFLVLAITFYMVVEKNAIEKLVWSIAPEKHQVHIMRLINQMQRKIGLWLRGQLILSLIVFTFVFSGLTIVNWVTGGEMKYALVLALLAGMTEFVPYLGPILAAIPAVFLALTVSPMLAVTVAVLYYVIQLIENNIIVPKLMQKVVGLNPIIIIAVLLIGFKVAGVAGAILAIPVATAVAVFVRDIFFGRGIGKEENEN